MIIMPLSGLLGNKSWFTMSGLLGTILMMSS
jgi:hypothetical protein